LQFQVVQTGFVVRNPLMPSRTRALCQLKSSSVVSWYWRQASTAEIMPLFTAKTTSAFFRGVQRTVSGAGNSRMDKYPAGPWIQLIFFSMHGIHLEPAQKNSAAGFGSSPEAEIPEHNAQNRVWFSNIHVCRTRAKRR
jgi:hypothetical protein